MGQGYSGGSKFVVDSRFLGSLRILWALVTPRVMGTLGMNVVFTGFVSFSLSCSSWKFGAMGPAGQSKERMLEQVPKSEKDRILSLSFSTELNAVWSKGLASPFIKIPMVGACHPVFSY